MSLRFGEMVPYTPFILEGVGVTLLFTVASLLCAMPLAVLLAFCKVSPRRRFYRVANFYTSIFRGTPLIVQLSLIYYATPQLTGCTLSVFAAGVLTFSLNSAAYASEVIKAGILAIDVGQAEAAKALGLSKIQTFRFIILPQAIRNIIPNLMNEMIDLLKESALISILGEADLMNRTRLVATEKFLFFEPYLIAASLYYILVMMMAYIGKKVETRLRYA